MARNRIALVDDEPGIRFGIRDYLDAKGYAVEEAASCAGALELLGRVRADAIVIDYLLPDGNAVDLLPRLRELAPGVPIVILTAHGSIDLAVRAIKEGAEQFLTKPVELAALQAVLERLLENQRNRQKQLAGRSQQARQTIDPFVGTSAAIRALEEQARKVALAESPILIQGETGTGKGVLARWLHQHGPRADEAFVDLDCAGLSRDLLESELFGHEKGAFTGAVAQKPGLLEVAHAGIVFLDEIGDVDAAVQPKLLKVLEEKRFRSLGDVRDRHVDIHLIAATHQDLAALVAEKKFRGDLYYRISAIPLVVPPLRGRPEDVPLLARALLRHLGRGSVELAEDAERALAAYAWPGNIRELKNVLERAVLLARSPVLGAGDLRFGGPPAAAAASTDGQLTLEELERRHIERVLTEERGHVDQAARRLGVPRSTLYQKIKRYGILIPR